MISLRSTRFAAFAAALAAAATFSANAGPSILVDGNTGVVLEQNDAFARWYPASLTKLMTTYVAFRAIDAGEVTLASPVRVSINATKEKPSKMGYPAGTVVTLENALRMIMVKSANDIATAIGESLGGSTEAFAARMNSEAKRIGMTGSNFVNPHGWHDERQYTTAHDMAVLALALKRDYPQYASFFDIEALSDGKVTIPNHNDMIFRFEGADGMKTGYTCDAGYNLVVSANRNGRTMVAVVLGATSVGGRTDDAAELLAA
ncbi:MAG: D-alanyl-D-alanine carboxypeptidase family protein, partial [Mesorhizobium sp.]